MIDHYSHTSTAAFRRCTYKFFQTYMEATKEQAPKLISPGLRMGAAGHVALKAFYGGKTRSQALDMAYEEFQPNSDTDLIEFQRLKAILEHYWRCTVTDRWTVLKVEEEVKVGKYMGILDLVVQTPRNEVWIVDHKFQKSKNLAHLDTNPQISFYFLLVKELGIKVDGLLYNIIPTSDGPSSPVRKLCFRSANFLSRFQLELDRQIQMMEEFQVKPNPIRNHTEDCKWDCPVYELCKQNMERNK